MTDLDPAKRFLTYSPVPTKIIFVSEHRDYYNFVFDSPRQYVRPIDNYSSVPRFDIETRSVRMRQYAYQFRDNGPVCTRSYGYDEETNTLVMVHTRRKDD